MRYNYYLQDLNLIHGTRNFKNKRKKVKYDKMLHFTRTFGYRYCLGNLMDISVKGHRSAKLKDEVATAAEFYGSILLPRGIAKNVVLDIELKGKLDDSAAGYCEYSEKQGHVKFFVIELDKKEKKEDMLKNLAHEMVHLKQFALGELSNGFVFSRSTSWHDRRFDDSKVDYWDQPWEIEAYGREIGLYARYVETFGC